MTADPPTSCPARTRLSPAEALDLYRDCSLHELGRRAFEATQQLHPEPYRTYVVDRNINYANYCTVGCTFCNFRADPTRDAAAGAGQPAGYVLSQAEIGRKVEELIAIGGTQVLLQGGIAPASILPFDWYLELLRFLKREYPSIHLHAFSPPEIQGFAEMFGMNVRDVLLRLREAGLDTIPGGGAEILVDRVRQRISPRKATVDQYLNVMREAHRIGMRTSITMMFGHLETIPERIEHWERIRTLQDETGGFTAYIGWTFQPGGTRLGNLEPFPLGDPGLPDGERLKLADATEYLRTTALARLFLDNIRNIQASWVTQGVKVGQLALFFGANDMGSVMMEENVVSAAGTTFSVNEAQIRRLIADAGFRPQKRDYYYRPID